MKRTTTVLLAPAVWVALLTCSTWALAQAPPVETTNGRGDLAALRAEAPALTADGTAWAADASVGQQIVLLLSGFEYFPTAEDLLQVTPDPVPYLLEVAYGTPDQGILPMHRNRAIAALAYFPEQRSWDHLHYMLVSPHTPEMTRHHVINALAMGFSDEALPAIQPYLAAGDLQLRLTAVAALESIGTAEARDLLEVALPLQTHDLVRESIERALISASLPDVQ